jgi:hypothetical protein
VSLIAEQRRQRSVCFRSRRGGRSKEEPLTRTRRARLVSGGAFLPRLPIDISISLLAVAAISRSLERVGIFALGLVHRLLRLGGFGRALGAIGEGEAHQKSIEEEERNEGQERRRLTEADDSSGVEGLTA